MTREPNFDELVGGEPMGADRERLRRAHELLLQAGAPPELPPGLEAGPTLKRVQAARRRQVKRRAIVLLAAALAVTAVFFGGYAFAHHGATANVAAELALRGTSAAPKARATLAVFRRQAGNWPMKLTVVGLPKSPAHSEYAVYLVQDGEHYPCGTFVSSGGNGPLTVTLNAPYRLQKGDWWIVTRHARLSTVLGPTVLRPA